MSGPRIVIGAGGTAGHVVPALAVADALRAEGAEVQFVGGERAERELVPAAGYELHPLRVVSLPRKAPVKALRAAAIDAAALRAVRRLLGELRPAVVLGAGGYVAGPVGLAALTRGVPLVLMEADSHLGLTNRLLAPLARRVCLAFPLPGRDSGRYLVTGRPVPPPATDRAAARARFDIGADATCVLVFGGSLGARSINLAAVEAFAGARFHVLHAAGERDLPDLHSPGPHYDLRGYISNFGEALLASDLVIARSGGSVFEIAAAGRPAVLIPYPHATADHQTTNARFMERAGAAIVIPDHELTAARLALEVGELLADRNRLAAMARAAAELARPDAAQVIAREVLAAIGRARWSASLDADHHQRFQEEAAMLFGQEHVKRYIETDGEEGHDWQGTSTLILTTTGRRSGEQRSTPLIYGQHGDDYVVVASKGGAPEHPAWYLNLSQHPEVTVQVRGDRFTAQARTASAEERPELWQIMSTEWPAYDEYQAKTDREIPLVVLERQ